MEKTLFRRVVWMLLLFTSLPFSSGNNNDEASITDETGFGPKFTGTWDRPKYTFNHQRPNFGGGQEIDSGACVRGCHCWAQPDNARQPVFVNCTNANKDTVPQVSVNALFSSDIISFYDNQLFTTYNVVIQILSIPGYPSLR